MHFDSIDDLQVCGEQRRLPSKIPRGRERNAVKHIRDIECVEVEGATCDTHCFVLPVEVKWVAQNGCGAPPLDIPQGSTNLAVLFNGRYVRCEQNSLENIRRSQHGISFGS